jgi:hypothetical protein
MQPVLSSQIQMILSDAYLFFTRHLKQIAAVCLPFLFVASLFGSLFTMIYRESPIALFATLGINLLIYPFYTAALIQLMARRARQEQPTNSELILLAIKYWGPLLVLKIIVSFFVGAAGILLSFNGIPIVLRLMSFLPVIWIVVRVAFAEFHLVLFDMSPVKAILKSFEDTKRRWGLVLILLLVTYVPIFILGLAADQLVQALTANDFLRIVVNTVWSLFGLFVHVVLFRAFMDVVSKQDDPQPSH